LAENRFEYNETVEPHEKLRLDFLQDVYRVLNNCFNEMADKKVFRNPLFAKQIPQQARTMVNKANAALSPTDNFLKLIINSLKAVDKIDKSNSSDVGLLKAMDGIITKVTGKYQELNRHTSDMHQLADSTNMVLSKIESVAEKIERKSNSHDSPVAKSLAMHLEHARDITQQPSTPKSSGP